jgi:hypothetical protein
VIPKDYGQRVLPEAWATSSTTWATSTLVHLQLHLAGPADQYGKVVRDGFASFFFSTLLAGCTINKPGLPI